jgi:DNA-binding IscR family transcriptional regulator
VASTRGAAGGYQLARPPEEIALADVLGVVDRADAPPARGRGTGRTRDVTALAAALHGVWDKIILARQQILRQTTLAELVEAGQGLQYVI